MGRCNMDSPMKFIRDAGYVWGGKTHRQRYSVAIYECSACGKQKEYIKTEAKRKKTSLCGECAAVATNTKHDLFGTRLYKIYMGMKSRCYNEAANDYKYYGANGVKICDEWFNDVTKFVEWAKNNGYKPHLSIDRIDCNGDYCPANCRWVDISTQNCNRHFEAGVTGYLGVTFEAGKFRASLTTRGKKVHLGRYNTVEEAALARNEYIDKNNLSNKYSVMEVS